MGICKIYKQCKKNITANIKIIRVTRCHKSPMKIIISESMLDELSTKANDKSTVFSGSSTVWFGKNYVKKIPIDGVEFSHVEMVKFKIMTKHPEIFPNTIIRKLSSGTIVLQKIVNTQAVESDVSNFIKFKIFDNIKQFARFMNSVAHYGYVTDYSIVDLSKSNNQYEVLSKYINLCLLLHKVADLLHMDLHDDNWGYLDGELKIIDF